MKIVFMGSSTFAIPSLRILNEAQYDIKAVYTQPPRKAGRGKRYKEVPLAEFAFSQGLKVEQPQTFNDPDVLAVLKSYNPDFLVVVAYGLILPRIVLEIPKKFSYIILPLPPTIHELFPEAVFFVPPPINE